MQLKTMVQVAAGIAVTGAFLIISQLIKDTEAIWIQTRILGLIAFLTLFSVVLLGELRLLAKDKSQVTLFRYHKPLAIFATYLVFLHLISAIADNYKWGKSLTFVQYLGFSFSDKWLVALSLGMIAFYLMLLIGFTSSTRSIRFIGFSRWKLIHYLSYVTFLIAYIHSVNLGTDLKHGALATALMVTFQGMLLLVTGLLLTRIINSYPVFEDQREVNLTAILILLVLLSTAFLAVQTVAAEQRVKDVALRAANAETAAAMLEAQVAQLRTATTADTANTAGGSNG